MLHKVLYGKDSKYFITVSTDKVLEINKQFVDHVIEILLNRYKKRKWLYLREVYDCLGYDGLKAPINLGWEFPDELVLDSNIIKETGYIEIFHNARDL